MIVDYMEFAPGDIWNGLGDATERSFSRLPFGAFTLDLAGRVIAYAPIVGEDGGPAAARIVGRTFFEEVAPWARNPHIYSRFMDAVETGQIQCLFDFVTEPCPLPLRVHMCMLRAPAASVVRIFIRRAAISVPPRAPRISMRLSAVPTSTR